MMLYGIVLKAYEEERNEFNFCVTFNLEIEIKVVTKCILTVHKVVEKFGLYQIASICLDFMMTIFILFKLIETQPAQLSLFRILTNY